LVIARLNVNSKRRALQGLAEKASSVIGHPEASIAAALRARERLGSTGIGNGVAIPHTRGCPTLHELFGLFARLDHPIDFAAVDNQPVDLLFLILAPASANGDQLGAEPDAPTASERGAV
jgi:PTS system nitrogen regulatory IIA component